MRSGLWIRGETCPVCGSREVRTDAVEEREWLLLAECPRCDHRWTQRFAGATARAAVKVAAPPLRPEVATAA